MPKVTSVSICSSSASRFWSVSSGWSAESCREDGRRKRDVPAACNSVYELYTELWVTQQAFQWVGEVTVRQSIRSERRRWDKLSKRLHEKIREQQEAALEAAVKTARDAAELQELRHEVQHLRDKMTQMQECVRLLDHELTQVGAARSKQGGQRIQRAAKAAERHRKRNDQRTESVQEDMKSMKLKLKTE